MLGRRTRQILEEQLDPALLMRPDLVSLFCGTNDLLRREFDADALGRDVEFMQRSCVASGATVVTFTLPDLASVMTLARCVASRLHDLNRTLRAVAVATGTILVDLASEDAAGGAGDDTGYAITLDASERVLVSGFSTNPAGDRDMVVWRFK